MLIHRGHFINLCYIPSNISIVECLSISNTYHKYIVMGPNIGTYINITLYNTFWSYRSSGKYNMGKTDWNESH